MTAVAPSRGKGLTPSQLTTACVSGAVALSMAALVALYTLDRPGGLPPRLQSVDARLARVEAIAQGADRAFAYPKGAVCTGSPDTAGHTLQAALSALTARTKLAAATSTAEPTPSDEPLQPLDVTVDGNGDYAAAVSTLRGLADLRPVLVLDRVDLVSRGTYLHLHATGRAYCRSPARL